MGINRQSTLLHWNFFLAMEEDLERLSRFIDFSGNDDAFSIEIARSFLGSCSEVDVVLKQLCKVINPASTAGNINAYFNEISVAFPNFKTFEVTIPRLGITLQPWVNWDVEQPPFWWQAHNKVKHHRHDHFEKANLKNCINSIAALYVAVLYLYKDEAQAGKLLQLPKLFNVSDAHFGGVQMGRFGNSFKYNL
jgi:hypothetical protein